MLRFLFNLGFVLTILQYASAVCNVCNENGVACINANQFHPCIQGRPNTTVTFSCPGENKVCTIDTRVCVDKTSSSAKLACGDTSNCGKCESEQDGRYTCTSRNTFTMCSGGALSNIRDTCPKNQMCDVSLAKQGHYPCVPSCRESKIEFCDLYKAIDEPEVTTVQPPTSTEPLFTTTVIFSPTPLPPTTTTTATTQTSVDLFCSQQMAVGRYPHPTDNSCQNYIYCFKKSGQMLGKITNCPPELYYSSSARLCVKRKPQGCA